MKRKRKPSWLRTRQRVLRLDTKNTIIKGKIDKMDFIKIKTAACKRLLTGWKDKLQTGENICKPKIWQGLIYLEYIKNCQTQQ